MSLWNLRINFIDGKVQRYNVADKAGTKPSGHGSGQMIQVNSGNVVTIVICGALGYMLVLGAQALLRNLQNNSKTAS